MQLLTKSRNKFSFKALILFSILCMASISKAYTFQTLKNNGLPSNALQNIMKLLDENPALSSAEILSTLQKKYSRKPEEERSAIRTQKKLENKKAQLMPLFANMEMVKAVYPHQTRYDYIVLLGATLESMRERAAFLNQLIEQNKIKIGPHTKLYVLAGKRDLFARENPLKTSVPLRKGWTLKKPLPTDEIEGAAWVIDQIIKSPSLRGRFKVLKTPKRFDEVQQKWVRPHTGNTITTLLRETGNNIQNKHFLFISSGPFAPYQKAVIGREFVDQNVPLKNLDVVSNQTKSSFTVSMYMDNARNTLQREIEVYQRVSAFNK